LRKSPFTPFLAFTRAVNSTPDHKTDYFVIPWDNQVLDYVYTAADKNVFKGAMTFKKLRKVCYQIKIYTTNI
jgi:hypothetical protein